MSIVAPKGRKHLCADALFRLLHEHFATIADDDVDEVEIPLDDALMSAFAMFSLKAPSLLGFDKQRADGNLKTIYGIERAPCDTRMRERLGDVSQVLIPAQRDCPNSYRLMKSPITRSCMRSVLEKHSVRRTSRLIRVRRLMCLLSIFCVFSLPT
jgi:hypothetical protein